MDNLNLIIFGGLSFFMFYLFFIMIKRDKEVETKFSALERGMDELTREVYQLKKSLKKDDKDSLKELEAVIEELISNIKELENNYLLKIKELEEKVESLRKNMKKVDFSQISGNDEQKVWTLYNNGYSIEEISKELRIPAGEIEFILKMKDI
jgi:chromosome segregation ATPase